MRTRRPVAAVVVVVAALLAVTPAWANAGTGMMWLGMLQLVVGNAFIGLLEWGVLHWLLGPSRNPRTAGAAILVGANYVSAWVGALLLVFVWPSAIARCWPEPLLQARSLIALSWTALFALTVLIEWPFVWWAARVGSTCRWSARRALGATAVVNVVSYALLVPLYYHVAPVTLATQTRACPAREIAEGLKARVYYLSPGGEVWETRIDGTQRRLVAATGLDTGQAEVFLVANSKTGLLDLYGDGRTASHGTFCVKRGVGRALRFADAETRAGNTPHRPRYEGTDDGGRDGYALDLRPTGQTDNVALLGVWAAEGVSFGPQAARRDRLHLALETPFLALAPGYGTLLEGDVLLCQYSSMFGHGMEQIVLLDLRGRRLAALAAGSCPVVVLEQLPAGASWWRPEPADDYDPQSIRCRVRGGKP